MPRLQELFFVDHVGTVEEGKQAVASRSYAACVSKLGTKGNLGKDVIQTLRELQGDSCFVAIHSQAAAEDASKRTRLEALGVSFFMQHGQETELLAKLALLGLALPEQKWPLLLFAPSNDPGFVESIMPFLSSDFHIDTVETAAQGVQKVRDRDYAACLAKLGTTGNLGSDLILALRGEQGPAPVVAIHSATVMRRPDWRTSLATTHGVSLYSQHGEEAALVSSLVRHVAASGLPRVMADTSIL